MGILIDDGVPELLSRPGEGHVLGSGATVPADGTKGWAHGALFFKTTGTTSADSTYQNVGSQTSANFDILDSAYIPTVAARTYAIPATDWRVFDAVQTNLPGTPADDDLGLVDFAIGTTSPFITTGTISGASATMKARVQVVVPRNYVAGQAASISIVGTQTDPAAVSQTYDVDVYRAAAPTVNICTFAAVSLQTHETTTTTASLTTTNLTPGELLDIMITIATDDTAGGGVSYAITSAYMTFTTLQ